MGRDRFEAAGNQYPTGGQAPNGRSGVGPSGAEWIGDNNVGLLCWDFHDAMSEQPRRLEAHMLIWAVGLAIIDNCVLGPAVDALREAGASAGLITAPALAIQRATGCLVNPLLIY
jgi:hypothetical protein